ncbi:MAG: hypothetical protein HYX56_03665 [Chloroflexi bacterium]|nr:hypothetical protein [Chloroflexota bacterium]
MACDVRRRQVMRIGVALPVFVLALLALPAAAASELTTALELCGTLKVHVPATASTTGSLTIGTRTYPIATGVAAGNGGVEVAVGRDLCVEGSVGATSGQLVRYLFFPPPPDARYCGTLLSTGGPDVTLDADFGQLRMYRGPDVPAPRQYQRVCYRGVVSRDTGDLFATADVGLAGPNSLERVHRCGTIRQYRPRTASADGILVVGSRTFTIPASGPGYTGDPAGDKTDRTTVGSKMCVLGTLVPTGDIANPALNDYLTNAMSTSVIGRVVAYRPPDGGSPGIAILSYASHFEFRIPAAIDAKADVVRDTLCYSADVDANGDISATAIIPCPQGGVAAGGTPSPIAAASPSTTATCWARPPG